jgi:Fuc2NAc and GlcNAc transferase
VQTIVIIAALLISWLGTLLIEHQADRLGLVQASNARSSHTRPTPSGGGLAIALASVLAATALTQTGHGELWTFAVLALCIALLGFADDLYDLSPALRFPIQALIFFALLWTSGPLPSIPLPLGLALAGPLLFVILLLVGLWWLNLFNFMDGIDGIAGSQAILLLLGGSAIWWLGNPAAADFSSFWLALAGAAATGGFLLRNWPPAKIFMGDAGSNAIALIIFGVAISTIAEGQVAYQPWLILPAVFVTDATVTLLRRLLRGERPWHAHRRHAYQQLSRVWGHRRVTLAYSGLTLAWTFPLAWAAQQLPAWSWWLVLLTYMPLVALSLRADAGGANEMGA